MPNNSEYANSGSEGASVNEAREAGSMLNFIVAKKIGSAMWIMRLYIIFLSIQFVFFSNAFAMDHYFTRAMLANGVVCALRIHQRIPVFRFSREHFAKCMQEDSAHYLMFSLIFLISSPVTVGLLPVFMFAVLHACSFTRQLIDCHGANSWFFLRKIINSVARKQTDIFRFIALTEIILMPTMVFMLFTGRCNFLAVLLFYKFLQHRYLSRRNPYSRLVFYELRVAAHQAMQHSACPSMLSWLVGKLVSLCCRLGPRIVPQHS